MLEIIKIDKRDAFYGKKDELIGRRICEHKLRDWENIDLIGWKYGGVILDDGLSRYFFAVKVKEVKEVSESICEECGFTSQFCPCRDCRGLDLTKKLQNLCDCDFNDKECPGFTPKMKWENGISPLQALCNLCGNGDCDCRLCRGKDGVKYGCSEPKACQFNEEFSFCPLFTGKETSEKGEEG